MMSLHHGRAKVLENFRFELFHVCTKRETPMYITWAPLDLIDKVYGLDMRSFLDQHFQIVVLTACNRNMSSYNLSCQNGSRLIWLYLAPLRPSTSSCSTLNMDFLENVTTSLLVLQICTTSWSTDILKSVEIVFKSYDDSLRSYSPWSMPWLMEDAGMTLVGS